MNEYLVVIIVMAVALAMDAFAVAITLGMDGVARTIRQRLKVAISFGFFQGLLFILGIVSLHFVSGSITTYNTYIAGAILIILGVRMAREGFEVQEDVYSHESGQPKQNTHTRGKMKKLTLQLLVMYGVATSIDALAAGITYGLIYDQILIPVICIASVAFVFSYVGASFGKTLGHIIGNKANILGGALLILLGLKSIFF